MVISFLAAVATAWPALIMISDRLSDVGVIVLVILSLLVWASLHRGRPTLRFPLELGLSIILTIIMVTALKVYLPAPRPITFLNPNVQLFDSFPSRHAAVAAATATVTASVYPLVALPFAALAGFIGLLRFLALAHWPLDILFGWLVGWLVSLLVCYLYTRCRRW